MSAIQSPIYAVYCGRDSSSGKCGWMLYIQESEAKGEMWCLGTAFSLTFVNSRPTATYSYDGPKSKVKVSTDDARILLGQIPLGAAHYSLLLDTVKETSITSSSQAGWGTADWVVEVVSRLRGLKEFEGRLVEVTKSDLECQEEVLMKRKAAMLRNQWGSARSRTA